MGVLAAEAEPVPAPMVGSFVGVLSPLLPETDSVTEPDVLLPEPLLLRIGDGADSPGLLLNCGSGGRGGLFGRDGRGIHGFLSHSQ